MFINRYLIQFAKGRGRLVAVACLYELVLTALGTGISVLRVCESDDFGG